jgi:hypothetical protein
MQKITRKISKVLATLSSLIVTFFILINSAEVLMARDLPLSNAMESFDVNVLDTGRDYVVPSTSPNLSGSEVGDYGRPITVNLPSMNRRLELLSGMKDNGKWLVRANKVHYFVEEGKLGIKSIFFYTIRGWRN